MIPLLNNMLDELNITSGGEVTHKKPEEELNEVSYLKFRTDKSSDTDEKRISNAIIEIRTKIREINEITDHSIKLKEDSNVTKDKFWTKAKKSLDEISSSLIKIEQKIRNLGN